MLLKQLLAALARGGARTKPAAVNAPAPEGYAGTIASTDHLPQDPAIEALYGDEAELAAFLALPPHEQMALIEGELSKLPAHEQRLISEILRKELSRKWIPLPGPQTAALKSEAFLTLYGGSAGGGKGLSLDTLLPCPSGFVSMADVKAGDALYDQDGDLCTVVGVSPISHRDCFEVEFDDGTVIVADDVHRWPTRTSKERDNLFKLTDEWRAARRARRPSRAVEVSQKPWVSASVSVINRERVHEYKAPSVPQIRDTAEIAATLMSDNGRRVNHSIDVCAPIVGTATSLPIDPYLLGLWLGDGMSGAGRIGMLVDDWLCILPHIDRGIVSRRNAIGPMGTRPYDDITFEGLQKDLRLAGLLGNKHIPVAYLRASVEQRKELLRGILDTDGSCEKRGKIEIGLSNRRLAEDVHELVSSLGIRSKLSTKRLSAINPKWADSHRLSFRCEFSVFKLPRKAERQVLTGHRDTVRRRYVVAVRPVPSIPTKCISVDSPSRTYLVGRTFVPTHNTDLILGLALTEHQRTMVVRREYDDLSFITERAISINGTRSGYAGSPHPVLRTSDGRLIEFRAFQRAGDEQKRQGQPIDLLAVDEAAQFMESQVQFLMGWIRSTDKGENGETQRRRVVLASNPPLSDEGQWLVRWFAPWLDPQHPNPAKPGELRWYVSDEEGNQKEVDGEGPHPIGQHMVKARSRTFIPARLQDNSYLMRDDDYITQLHSLPEPLRSAMRDGNFMAARKDDAWQVIPSEWIRLAQARWTPRPPAGQNMTCISLDPAGGGRDAAAIAHRYGLWFGPVKVERGPQTADGRYIGARVIMERRNNCQVVVDLGGGYGGEVVNVLKDNTDDPKFVLGVKGSEGSTAVSVAGKFPFANMRAEVWYRMREALDPASPEPIALPPDPELAADLATPRQNPRVLQSRGVIQIEDKEEIKKRLGRSPDKGDAVVNCRHFGGLLAMDRKQHPRLPTQANVGHASLKKFATSARR